MFAILVVLKNPRALLIEMPGDSSETKACRFPTIPIKLRAVSQPTHCNFALYKPLYLKMSIRRKGKKSSLEGDIDKFRCSKDWTSALNYVRRSAKGGGITPEASTHAFVLECIVNAEYFLDTWRDVEKAR